MEELMLLENPYYNPWYGKPRRHSKAAKKGWRSRRNPKGGTMRSAKIPGGTMVREWTQNTDLMDVGAAVGGLAMAAMIPSAIIPVAETGMRKFLKILVSFGSAVGAGMIFRNLSASAGKAAVLGGLAGTATQAIGTYTGVEIGKLGAGRRPLLPVGRGLATGSKGIGQTTKPGFEDVQIY